jgi:neutral trehalase
VTGILRAERFAVEPVDFNAIYAESLTALAKIAALLGRSREEARFSARAKAVTAAIRQKMWDEQAGMFWDLSGENETPLRASSAAAFVALFGGAATAAQAARLVEQYRTSFTAPYPVPTTTTCAPHFDPDSYWRGSTWLNVNYLIAEGLRRYGFADIADEIGRASLVLVQQSGFREHYNPITGAGGGSRSHSWSGIILDLKPLEKAG